MSRARPGFALLAGNSSKGWWGSSGESLRSSIGASPVGPVFGAYRTPNFSIHRANLIGMGVLPLGFTPGTTRLTRGLNGSETYAVIGETLQVPR